MYPQGHIMPTREHYIATDSSPTWRDYCGAIVIGVIIVSPLVAYFLTSKPT